MAREAAEHLVPTCGVTWSMFILYVMHRDGLNLRTGMGHVDKAFVLSSQVPSVACKVLLESFLRENCRIRNHDPYYVLHEFYFYDRSGRRLEVSKRFCRESVSGEPQECSQ